jgi:hypothetical protein
VEECRVFNKALKELLSEVAAKQNAQRKLNEERSGIVNRVNIAQVDWSNKRRLVEVEMQHELDEGRAHLAGVLKALDERRRAISEREGADLRALQGSHPDRIAFLDRDIAGLSKRESDEKDQALRELRELHFEAWMRKFPIAGSNISGIGQEICFRLRNFGYVTASDLRQPGFTSVPGIGPKRANALRDWRDRIRAQVVGTAPTSLPAAAAASIAAKFYSERTKLVREKSGLEDQLRSATAAVRAKYAGERGSVDRDERSQRDSSAREEASLRQRYGALMQQVDKGAQAQRTKDQAAVTEITEKLRQFDKGFSALQWRCARKQREGERYKGMGFAKFLRSVAGL